MERSSHTAGGENSTQMTRRPLFQICVIRVDVFWKNLGK
jgi:hypothetical protein